MAFHPALQHLITITVERLAKKNVSRVVLRTVLQATEREAMAAARAEMYRCPRSAMMKPKWQDNMRTLLNEIGAYHLWAANVSPPILTPDIQSQWAKLLTSLSGRISQEALDTKAGEPAFVSRMKTVAKAVIGSPPSAALMPPETPQQASGSTSEVKGSESQPAPDESQEPSASACRSVTSAGTPVTENRPGNEGSQVSSATLHTLKLKGPRLVKNSSAWWVENGYSFLADKSVLSAKCRASRKPCHACAAAEVTCVRILSPLITSCPRCHSRGIDCSKDPSAKATAPRASLPLANDDQLWDGLISMTEADFHAFAQKRPGSDTALPSPPAKRLKAEVDPPVTDSVAPENADTGPVLSTTGGDVYLPNKLASLAAGSAPPGIAAKGPIPSATSGDAFVSNQPVPLVAGHMPPATVGKRLLPSTTSRDTSVSNNPALSACASSADMLEAIVAQRIRRTLGAADHRPYGQNYASSWCEYRV
ncbi:hypothetical protein HWV62_30141 [Athelia sp. TMB]|nr:hypothetical protein HWV62_30141 [Athelia sp. TMB]